MADSLEEAEKESFQSLTGLNAPEEFSEQGERFSHFRNILMKCTDKCFAPARLEKISSCLPDIKKKNPDAFESIIQQLVEGLQANVKQELELMIKQENLVSLCHELDQITEKSKEETNPAWRPSGKPNEDIKDHVLHTKFEFREKLKDKLKQLQNENKAVQENIIMMRKEVTDTEERIMKKHQKLQKIAEICDDFANGNNNNSQESLEKIVTRIRSLDNSTTKSAYSDVLTNS